jgi:hypothetical protein
MKSFLIALIFVFSGHVFAAPICQFGDATSLIETWKLFQSESLNGMPDNISKFYKFPLKLLSPFDGDKPIVISKKVFLKNYQFVFREDSSGEERELFKALKRMIGNDLIRKNDFDKQGCSHPAPGAIRVGEYNFIWSKKNRWAIESIFYGDSYFDLMSSIENNELIK